MKHSHCPPASKILAMTLLKAFRHETEKTFAEPHSETRDKKMKRLFNTQKLLGITGKGKFWETK